jgi:hypothetical protein
MAVKGAEGGRVGEVGLEGADQVVEESWVVSGAAGIERIELVTGHASGVLGATLKVNFLLVLSSMAKINFVSITQERQVAFPPEILETLEPGDEYLLWQTDDTIVLKKITQPISFNTLFARIEALGPDPNQPTETEVCEIVKTIRYERARA